MEMGHPEALHVSWHSECCTNTQASLSRVRLTTLDFPPQVHGDRKQNLCSEWDERVSVGNSPFPKMTACVNSCSGKFTSKPAPFPGSRTPAFPRESQRTTII